MHDYDSILLIEDNVDDAKAIIKAFCELKINNPLVHAPDKKSTLDYLHKSSTNKPRLIILSLNTSKTDGITLLEVIKTDETIRPIPIVILTSDSKRILPQCYEIGIAGYFIKPDNYDQLVKVIEVIHHYWALSSTPTLTTAQHHETV